MSTKIREYLESKGPFIRYQKRVTAIRESIIDISLPNVYKKKKIPSDVNKTRADSGVLIVEGDENDRTTYHYPSMEVTANMSQDCQDCQDCQYSQHSEDCQRCKHCQHIQTKYYGHVISTLPLTVLRTIDLKDAGLNVMQSNALRALDYGPSIKIAILFKSDWWYQKLGIIGGQSFTDLPIRTIVYPSYGVDSPTPSKVLIASYSWTTDASRLGALASEGQRDVLKELVLRNLADAHYGVNGNQDVDYDFLVNEYKDMHVKDWNVDENAMGTLSAPLPFSADIFLLSFF